MLVLEKLPKMANTLILAQERKLNYRFAKVKLVKGIMTYNSVLARDERGAYFKEFSFSTQSVVKYVTD